MTAEILALPRFGIGNQMYLNKLYLETDELFAWTLIVILCSVLVEKGLERIVKKVGERA